MTDCQECMSYIAQDDPIWFGTDGEKLSRQCAAKQDRICPECNGQAIVYCCDEAGANPPNEDKK